jgi:hypothetical protein
MFDLDQVFDRDISRRPPYARLPAEALALFSRKPRPPDPKTLPDGNGQAVLVIPAFLVSDAISRDLRRFLKRCNFAVYGWALGINVGPTPRILHGLERRFDQLQRQHGNVALIGISMGGLLARNLAYSRADHIPHVITVASPFRLPTASPLEPLVRFYGRSYSEAIDPARLNTPLPVPSTMIYTPKDGIVASDSCWTDEAGGEVIAVDGTHMLLSSHPESLRAIVRRLATPAPAAGH